jgi:hypothetical protein
MLQSKPPSFPIPLFPHPDIIQSCIYHDFSTTNLSSNMYGKSHNEGTMENEKDTNREETEKKEPSSKTSLTDDNDTADTYEGM